MPATTTVRWDPSRLNSTIDRGNRLSFAVAHKEALAIRKAKAKTDIDLDVISSNQAVMQPQGLQATFERGREGGYPVAPKDGPVLVITSGPAAGRVVRAVVGGPMRPYPAMGPASQVWARGGYNKTAKANLAASGFR